MRFYFLLLTSYRLLLASKLTIRHGSIYGFGSFYKIALIQKKIFCTHPRMPKYQVKVRSHKITLYVTKEINKPPVLHLIVILKHVDIIYYIYFL